LRHRDGLDLGGISPASRANPKNSTVPAAGLAQSTCHGKSAQGAQHPRITITELNALHRAQWCRSRTELTHILVDNPAQLYGF
jgi:hypothetical protein